MADKRASLEQVIQTAIDTATKEMHTVLPAVVTRVDNINQLIDAQVTVLRKLGGEMVKLPLLVDVPIRYPRSAIFSITFPIEIDDHVMVHFAERSIDNWLIKGGFQNPLDVRKFSLSDAFAIPSMYPQTDLIPGFNENHLEIKTNTLKTIFRILEGEKFFLTTESNEGGGYGRTTQQNAPGTGVAIAAQHFTDDPPTDMDFYTTVNIHPSGGATIIAKDVKGGDTTTVNIANGGITITTDGSVDVVADGDTTITSAKTTINNNVEVVGTLSASGKITCPELSANGVNYTTHRHVESGGGTTGTPTN